MLPHGNRRRFLRTTSAASLLGVGDLAGFLPHAPASADEARVTPDVVRYGADTEPTVRLIEQTPIDKCSEMLAGLIRRGVPYRHLLASLFLAALRGPSTIAHSVFVIHSAHQLGLDAPPEERLLPLFWSLHNYKYWSAWHAKNPNRLRPFTGTVRPTEKADDFHAAMDRADAEGAEAALLGLVRGAGLNRVAEALWPYAAKDSVDIGHNAITVASALRVLPVLGERHAEPVLRWVVGRVVSKGDRTYWPNRERVRRAVEKLPPGWAAAEGDAGLTRDLLGLMRELKVDDACQLIIARLTAGKSPAGAVWDAVHLHAAEVMMRKPDASHPLHANTGANALHYAFRASGESAHRLLILLQSIGWQCHHRQRKMETDPQWRASKARIDALEEVRPPEKDADAIREALAALPSKPAEAAAMVHSLTRKRPEAGEAFMRAAGRLVLTKATENAHDVKFPVAMFEDQGLVDPAWRPHLLAASVYWLKGSGQADSEVIQKAREAMGKS